MVDGKKKYQKYLRAYEGHMFDKPSGFDTFMRSYIKGFAIGLDEKFEKEKNEFMIAHENCFALIRTNELAIKEYVGKVNIKNTAGPSIGNAFHEGKKSGETVIISKGLSSTPPNERKMLG